MGVGGSGALTQRDTAHGAMLHRSHASHAAPKNCGLDRLMAAFDLMNQQQLDELKRRNVKLRGR